MRYVRNLPPLGKLIRWTAVATGSVGFVNLEKLLTAPDGGAAYREAGTDLLA